jgi:hypothetical protein
VIRHTDPGENAVLYIPGVNGRNHIVKTAQIVFPEIRFKRRYDEFLALALRYILPAVLLNRGDFSAVFQQHNPQMLIL